MKENTISLKKFYLEREWYDMYTSKVSPIIPRLRTQIEEEQKDILLEYNKIIDNLLLEFIRTLKDFDSSFCSFSDYREVNPQDSSFALPVKVFYYDKKKIFSISLKWNIGYVIEIEKFYEKEEK